MINNSLAGAMMWSLDLDDFNDRCHSGKFPLTTAMRYAIDNAEIVTISVTTTVPVSTISETTVSTKQTTTEKSSASNLLIATMTEILLIFASFILVMQYLSNVS